MTRLSLVSMLPAAVLLVAACATDTADPAPETETGIGAPHASGAGHMLLMPSAAHKARRRSGEASNAHMVYRGGPVISNVKIFTVFWNASVSNQSALDSFYGTLANSAYVDQLSEYSTSTQTIGRGKFIGTYVDTGAPSTSQLSDSDVQKELARLVDANAVPAPDGNTLYMIHFPAGVSISMDGATSCQQFCAYHASVTHGSGTIYYGVMPDFSGACSSCGGESTSFNGTTVVASHEVAEAITDPNIGVANATNDEHQLGWYDDQNDEIGDVCEGQSVTFAGYRVTEVWSNKQNACAAPQDGGGTGGGGTGGGGTGGSTSSGSGGGTGGGVPTPTPTPSSCSHSMCEPGAPLSQDCNPCANAICWYAPECCTEKWARECAEMAIWYCPEQCQ
jgi:hypothetical protein